MKKHTYICIAIAFAFNFSIKAQTNLVPNPSFEDTVRCPISLGDDGCVVSWISYGNSPDYFNTCHNISASASVPSNYYGFQQPHSGNGYYGMIAFSSNGSYREPIGCNLISPLITNQKYYVSASICMANCSFQGGSAANKLGVVFTNINYSSSNPIPINDFAHVFTNSVITDTLSWTRITGSFIADASYAKMAFGNFFTDQNTNSSDPINCGLGIAYYYVDDICVSTDSTYSANYITEMNSINNNNAIRIYPNPTSDILNIETNLKTLPIIYDLLGNQLDFNFEKTLYSYMINVSQWNKGVYLLKLKDTFYKIIINP